MTFLKTHYEVTEYGSIQANDAWKREGIIPGKVKFCDGLMMRNGREYDFTSETDDVNCKKCQKKIDMWTVHGFELPR